MILAIDLGGTKLQFGVFSLSGSLLIAKVTPTEVNFLTQLKKIIQEQQANFPQLALVSLGVPGPTINNTMQGSKPLNCASTINFDVEFGNLLIRTIVRNDLHMAAQCVIREGAGKEFQQLCLVSLSTGIGVAVINRGQILHGRIEMGHQVLDPGFTPRQPCINHDNCWVALASGAGIVNRFGNETYNSTRDIFEHVLDEQDLSQLRTTNAHAFGNLINAYDPEAIVIMGSLGLAQFNRIMPSAEEIEQFTINRPIPPIIKAESAENTGMLGAFYAAREELDRQNAE